MRSFSQFILNEALLKISNNDVNIIFEPIKNELKRYQALLKNPDDRVSELLKNFSIEEFKVLGIIDSDKLKSPDAKIAHKLKPIKIYIGIGVNNHYSPNKSYIYVGVTSSALKGLKVWDHVPINQRKDLRNEFSDLRIKSTIAHELTHWMDDSKNNMHITKGLKSAQENPVEFEKFLKAGNKDVGLGHVEINAVVNQIAHIKKKIGKKYNIISWQELVSLHPSLSMLDAQLGVEWRKKVWSRMARENLLTPNFR